jgi:glycosyltransferase involved in cell wall biosynthesis
MKIALDTSALSSGHSGRGVGRYTAWLEEGLAQLPDVELVSNPLQADLWHIPYFSLFSPQLPLHSHTPVVVTIHDVIPLRFPEGYPVGLRGKAGLLWQRLALTQVIHIITDSIASKADIVRFLGVHDKKISVVPLAANPELAPQPKRTVADVLKKLKITQPYVLYVGDINYNKNLPALIRALELLPKNLQLVLVGRAFKPQPIPEWQAIEAAVASLKHPEQVRFVNDIGSDGSTTLAALYTGAVTTIQPSLWEGFGLPVLESFACGTPVVATHVSSLPEVGGDVAIYSKDTSSEGLAEAIEKALKLSNSERANLSQRATDWAAQFSWGQTAVNTAHVYSQVLENL